MRLNPPQALLARCLRPMLAHPVLTCAFRPFFLLTAISGALLLLLWLASATPLPLFAWLRQTMPGGGTAWHAHELIYGYGMAAVAGFLLVAVPEFTQTPAFSHARAATLALLWLLARLAYLAAPIWPFGLGLWPALLCNLALGLLLAATVLPPLLRASGRGQSGFAWGLICLLPLQAGFFAASLMHGDGMRWLHAAVGALMALIIVAASRISMRIVNSRIHEGRLLDPLPETPLYLARPPRRNFAIFTIALCAALEFLQVAPTVLGWCALAACAAMLNLLNDWHVGRPLLTRWALMLYACYWLMALGYGLMGAHWLGLPGALSAGRHLLMIGGMGLSIFAVMCIAGRFHSGHWLDQRRWIPLSAIALCAAALLRAWAGLTASPLVQHLTLAASGLLWVAVFSAYAVYFWPILTRPRTDGLEGCAEPLSDGHGGASHQCG